MSYILHIETATKVCSVALSNNGKLISLREEHSNANTHSSMLTVFVEEVLQQGGIDAGRLSAVAVSKGPGSYTGLRIGVSAAKGICYGLDIPLISVNSLEALAWLCWHKLSERQDVISAHALEAIYCPMIDARRMEVYLGQFNHELEPMADTRAMIVMPGSFSDTLDTHKMFFFGDGSEKCKHLLKRKNAIFIDNILSSAQGLIVPATRKFAQKEFEDVAYFEPFYLKEFVAGTPRVKGLYPDF